MYWHRVEHSVHEEALGLRGHFHLFTSVDASKASGVECHEHNFMIF